MGLASRVSFNLEQNFPERPSLKRDCVSFGMVSDYRGVVNGIVSHGRVNAVAFCDEKELIFSVSMLFLQAGLNGYLRVDLMLYIGQRIE